MNRGLVIVFEGIDGSGKSTLAKMLNDYINGIGRSSIVETEPTSDTLVGKALRDYLKNPQIDEATMALLFAADRVEHVKKIKYWLDEGVDVICDRYIYSTFAYQGEHPSRDIHNLLRDKFLTPDITFYIDGDPEICLERIKSRSNSLDKYENVKKLETIRNNYQNLLSHSSLVYSYPKFSMDPFVIDKELSLEDSFKKIVEEYHKVEKAYRKSPRGL